MSPWSHDSTSPAPVPLTYDAHLPSLNAGALKRIARLWVGKEASKLNKEACIRAIGRGLADPAAVRQALAGLSDFERAGLGLLKRYGQAVPTDVLATELLMLGMPFQERNRGSMSWSMRNGADYRALNSLLHQGMVLPQQTHQGYGYPADLTIDEYHHSAQVFAAPCVLDAVETVPPRPLALEPISKVEPAVITQPAAVVLRLIGMTETLRKLGDIPLTTKGRPPKPFLTKLAKLLGWDVALAQDTQAPLVDATGFFFWLLAGLGLYVENASGPGLRLSAETTTFFATSYATQATHWLSAYRMLTDWLEYRPQSVWLNDTDPRSLNKFVGMRAALLLALAALPDSTAWYRMTALSAAMYERLGEYVSLTHMAQFYPLYQATPEEVEHKRQAWRQQLSASWQATELPWLRSCLSGPLVHLGLVALAREPGQQGAAPTLFSLTPLGRVVLYEALRDGPQRPAAVPAVAPPQPHAPCWIVQPNFDVVVYLDRASATHLAFIERIAARKPSSGATALYHLTRDTVYTALESGIAADTLCTTLRDASVYPLPDNVRQMLDEWAARRERLTVYRHVDMLEFPDQATRDAALANRTLAGQAVGERFVVLSPPTRQRAPTRRVGRTVDYLAAPVRCLHVEEDGTVHILPAHADVLVYGEIAAWAEPGAETAQWRLTRASIVRAVQAGWTAASIVEGLRQRALQPVPALLSVAIRAWAGERSMPRAVAVASDVILQVADLDVAEAIAGSTLLQPYIRGQLGPRTFLVHQPTALVLQHHLAELGLAVGDELLLVAPAAEAGG